MNRDYVNEFKSQYTIMLYNRKHLKELDDAIELIQCKMENVKSPNSSDSVQIGNSVPRDRRLVDLIERKERYILDRKVYQAQVDYVSDVLSLMDVECVKTIQRIYECNQTYEDVAKDEGYSTRGLKYKVDGEIETAVFKSRKQKIYKKSKRNKGLHSDIKKKPYIDSVEK